MIAKIVIGLILVVSICFASILLSFTVKIVRSILNR